MVPRIPLINSVDLVPPWQGFSRRGSNPGNITVVGAGVMDSVSVLFWEMLTGGSSTGWSSLITPKPQTKTVNKHGITRQSELHHYPDPLHCLVGDANEFGALVEKQSFLAFIDSGAQICTITKDLVVNLQLPIHTLGAILNITGTRGCRVPYQGYVEVHLQVPSVKVFDSDVLLLVVSKIPYGD